MKQYSEPKINICNGDLKKAWFVSYSYRNPETGKMVAFQDRGGSIGGVNRFKTKTERINALNELRKVISNSLKEGFNPFAPTVVQTTSEEELSVLRAFEIMETTLKGKLSTNSWSATKSRLNRFKTHLGKAHLHHAPVKSISQNICSDFLTHLKVGAVTHNNYLADLRSAFKVLEVKEFIVKNPFRNLEPKDAEKRKNTPFTKEQVKEISTYLQQKDALLLLFIRMVGYEFLRPKEVASLQVKHLNFENRTLRIDTKTKLDKTKIIVNAVFEDLQKHCEHAQENDFLFSRFSNYPMPWPNVNADYRRDYWGKRFKTVVKDKFKLGTEYGIYSFRHTFSIELYNTLIKGGMGEKEAKWKMLPITGHQSIGALENYLRDIGAILPDDYSDMLNLDL